MTLARDVVPVLGQQGRNTRLVAVGIGTATRAKEFSEHVGFPQDLLYADPENIVYDELKLVKNVANTFFNPNTPLAIAERIRQGRTKDLTRALQRWHPWIPPKLDQGLQQGGAFVFEGKHLLYSRKDSSTGDHVDINTLLDVVLKQ